MKQPRDSAQPLTERLWYKRTVAAVDEYLRERLAADHGVPASLAEAMRYAVFGPGKRMRPVLVMAACEAAGGDPRTALPAAAAVELIHTYSLVHDDLPAMDDDDLRRGRPTVHVVYGEATAILVGDALLTLAFDLVAGQLPALCGAQTTVDVTAELAQAAGWRGLIAGQVEDLAAEGRQIDGPALERIHRAKTGALFTACARIGGIIAQADPQKLGALTTYGEAFGLAFQIIDDVLDEVGDAARMGRPRGRDRDRGKATFTSIHGLAAARERAAALVDQALGALSPFGAAGRALAELVHFVAARDH
ncbi:MAG TPA: farnesyl diphosphate synthase [Sphingobacteriaceae bacterium]|nr:farnesyl diphosphate synthase [Sphingobacteriaceae bacterium]